MASDLQELKILLAVRDREFARAMDRNTKRIQRFSQQSNKNLSKTTKSFNRLGNAMRGLIPALGAAMLVAKVKSVTASMDEIGKTADNLGLTTDALQELRVVAESSGISFDEFTKAFQKFTVGIGEATDGTGTARDALEKLGVSIYTASGQVKGSEQIFNEVSDALSGFTNDSERAGIAADLFGQRVGVKMLNLLRNGSQGMADMRAEARKLGVVIDEGLIRKAEDAQTQLDLLARVMNAQVSSALIDLAPLLVDVSKSLGWLAQRAGEAYQGFQWVYSLATAGEDAGTAWMDAATKLHDMEAAMNRLSMQGGVGGGSDARTKKIEEMTAAIAAQRVETERLLGVYLDSTAPQEPQAPPSQAAPESGGGQSGNAALEAALIAQIDYMKSLSMTSSEIERQNILEEDAAKTRELLAIARKNDGVVSDAERESILMVMNALEKERLAMLDNTDGQGANSSGRSSVTASATEQADALQRVADAVRAEQEARAAGNEALARSFGDAIQQANTFREALDNVLKMAVKLAATSFLQGLFGVAPQGQSGIAAAISGFGAKIGGGRAMGGAVSAGVPFRVGENGPELFVPRESGTILTPAQSRRAQTPGGGTVVNMTLNVSTGVQSTVRAEMASMLPQIESVAKRAVIEANQRGGSFRHALTGG